MGGPWNSPACWCDLAALSAVAPKLELLELKGPRLHIGRVSRRAGQSDRDVMQMGQKFCATSLAPLRGICSIFPSLQELHIEKVKDGSCADSLEGDEDLATFFGLGQKTGGPSRASALRVRAAAGPEFTAAAERCSELINLDPP